MEETLAVALIVGETPEDLPLLQDEFDGESVQFQ